jgi:hypothetical protein
VHFSVEVESNTQALILEVAFGNEETKIKTFSKDHKLVKIGRNRDNDIQLENYAYSRIHSTFFYNPADESWYVQDGIENRTSTNGTWIYLDWPWKIEESASFRIGPNFLRIKKI